MLGTLSDKLEFIRSYWQRWWVGHLWNFLLESFAWSRRSWHGVNWFPYTASNFLIFSTSLSAPKVSTKRKGPGGIKLKVFKRENATKDVCGTRKVGWLTSEVGGESQPKYSPDVSFQRVVQDALLQTQHRLVHESGNEPVLHIRVWRTATYSEERTPSKEQKSN